MRAMHSIHPDVMVTLDFRRCVFFIKNQAAP